MRVREIGIPLYTEDSDVLNTTSTNQCQLLASGDHEFIIWDTFPLQLATRTFNGIIISILFNSHEYHYIICRKKKERYFVQRHIGDIDQFDNIRLFFFPHIFISIVNRMQHYCKCQ